MNFAPNGLFYEMFNIYKQNKREDNKIIICNEGGSRCFAPSQLVKTSKGDKMIKDIVVGDIVYSLNETTQEIEPKKVINIFSFWNTKKSIRLKLKNGETIECTEDHEFYFEGGWHSLKHLLSLKKKIDGELA